MSIIPSVKRLESQSKTILHKWLNSKDCANRGKKFRRSILLNAMKIGYFEKWYFFSRGCSRKMFWAIIS